MSGDEVQTTEVSSSAGRSGASSTGTNSQSHTPTMFRANGSQVLDLNHDNAITTDITAVFRANGSEVLDLNHDNAITTNITVGTMNNMQLREPSVEEDSGLVAGIVIAVVTVVLILAALIAFFVYRHYLHRNVTSSYFDNPVYRKTTEDQFCLEKSQYQTQRIYPATVGEEAQKPLTNPGTNDYV
jgi:hypothetical protein